MLKQACLFCKIVGFFAIVGAINWGLVGVFGFNLVEYVLGVGTVATDIVYDVVGLSGLALLGSYFMSCPFCKKP